MSQIVTSVNSKPNFKVRNSVVQNPPSNNFNLHSGVVLKNDLGATGKAIPASLVLGHTIIVSPVTASQTYTLPTASSLLSEFGRSIDTGVPTTRAGNMIVFNVVNRGTSPAYIKSNTVGGDGTAIIAYNGGVVDAAGPSYTGATVPVGKITPVYLEWLSVSGGLDGATGTYTLYN